MTAPALLPGAVVLIDTDTSNPYLDFRRGDRATVVGVEADGWVLCELARTGGRYCFDPRELVHVAAEQAS